MSHTPSMGKKRKKKNKVYEAHVQSPPPMQPAAEVPASVGDDAPADTIYAQKVVAYYSAAVNAWITTRMEFDRTLVTLSTGGLGLFLTLATTVGVQSSTEIIFYIIGTVGFVTAIGCGLVIFQLNADVSANAITSKDEEDNPTLASLDKVLKVSFFIGALAAIVAGSSAAYASYIQHKSHALTGENLPDDKKAQRPAEPAKPPASAPKTGADTATESINGMRMLRPQADKPTTHSIDGFQKFRPVSTTGTPTQKAPPPAPVKPPPKK